MTTCYIDKERMEGEEELIEFHTQRQCCNPIAFSCSLPRCQVFDTDHLRIEDSYHRSYNEMQNLRRDYKRHLQVGMEGGCKLQCVCVCVCVCVQYVKSLGEVNSAHNSTPTLDRPCGWYY